MGCTPQLFSNLSVLGLLGKGSQYGEYHCPPHNTSQTKVCHTLSLCLSVCACVFVPVCTPVCTRGWEGVAHDHWLQLRNINPLLVRPPEGLAAWCSNSFFKSSFISADVGSILRAADPQGLREQQSIDLPTTPASRLCPDYDYLHTKEFNCAVSNSVCVSAHACVCACVPVSGYM